jgi:hypothetical protein
MSRYVVWKCDSINSYICLHFSKATSDFVLVLSYKDQAFLHNDFFSSWSALSKAKFVRQTFLDEAHAAGVMADRITKLILHLSRKIPSGSVVIPVELGLSRRSLLTDVQNIYLRGSSKPVPKKPKCT